jgi:hypothetical protein
MELYSDRSALDLAAEKCSTWLGARLAEVAGAAG